MAILTFMVFIFAGILFAAWKKHIRSGPVYKTNVSLKGKTVLVTGGSSGLGKMTAVGLAKHHARVIIASRNEAKAEAAVQEIVSESGNKNVEFMSLNLSDLDNIREFVRHFASKEPRLDILINNAGVISDQPIQNGGSVMFNTNILGPFLLTNLLLPLLEETGSENPTRVVNITSDAYLLAEIDLENINPSLDTNSSMRDILSCYSATKLMAIYFTTELEKLLRARDPENFNVTTYILHPGTAFTSLGEKLATRSIFWNIMRQITLSLTSRSTFLCSQTVLYCCMEPGIEPGGYFSDLKISKLWPHAKDPVIGRKLWIQLERLSGLR